MPFEMLFQFEKLKNSKTPKQKAEIVTLEMLMLQFQCGLNFQVSIFFVILHT